MKESMHADHDHGVTERMYTKGELRLRASVQRIINDTLNQIRK